jgi:putative transposase
MLTDTTKTLEAKELFKGLLEKPEKLFEMLEIDFKSIAEKTISELLKAELTNFLGREKYEHSLDGNHRNGHYTRGFTVKNIGELVIKIPRDRFNRYRSIMIRKYERYDDRLKKDISLMFLSGMSTRGIQLISKSLLGRTISSSEVSKVNEELLSGIDKWRTRDLSDERIKYIYVDGVYFKMRSNRQIKRVPILVVIGVTETNKKKILCIQQGDKESAPTWREVFKDLKIRGLNKDIELGIMDGLPGLMDVFLDEFPLAKIQRCQVHVSRNVLCKVPQNRKKEVSDGLREIFYAPNKEEAEGLFIKFMSKYVKEHPSAANCISNVIKECLTFYSFPQGEWISLRTTNPIERVNKEFKRRTNSMEILAGESSAYRLLSFIALKMELTWRCTSFASTTHNNLNNLIFKDFQNFTQLS